jgi:HK97 family phage major capsid protein/HK97 family phage prohead protease
MTEHLRDDLIRGHRPALEVRAASTLDGVGTLVGHFSVFDTWYEVDSIREGHFLEQVRSGAFARTIAEDRSAMRVTFNHGQDPQLGDKVLGPIDKLEEDATGAYYEVPLLDTSYNRDLAPGIRAGLYGSSFRFSVTSDEWDQAPRRSKDNPGGIPERTITEARVSEFGPVTFPANAAATAGVRSLTDRFRPASTDRLLEAIRAAAPDVAQRYSSAAWDSSQASALVAELLLMLGDEMDDKKQAGYLQAAIDALQAFIASEQAEIGTPEDAADSGMSMNSQPRPGTARTAIRPAPLPAPTSPASARKEIPVSAPTVAPPDTGPDPLDEYRSVPEMRAAIEERQATLAALDTDAGGRELPADAQVGWDRASSEIERLQARIAAVETRRARLAELASRDTNTIPGDGPAPQRWSAPNQINVRSEAEITDVVAIRAASRSDEEYGQLLRDNAMRAMERTAFPNPVTDKAATHQRIGWLLDNVDSKEKHLARRILTTGNPTYKRAFDKILRGLALNAEEQRAAALAVGVDGTGGFAVPFAFDPTVIAIGAHTGAVNPYRATCRVVPIVGTDTWNALTATAITATRTTEAAASTEQGPTFAQPQYIVKRIHAMVSASIEMLQDRPNLPQEISGLIQEAKDNEEEASFAIGVGGGSASIGVVAAFGTSGAYTQLDTAGSVTLAAADADLVEAALPVRHRFGAQWFMNRVTLRKFQAVETAGGKLFQASQYFQSAGNVNLATDGNTGLKLLGYPVNESPSVATAATSHITIAALINPQQYVIVDRVGMSIEVIPHLFGPSQGNLPTGQRGIYALWRNTAAPLNVDAGRILDYKT